MIILNKKISRKIVSDPINLFNHYRKICSKPGENFKVIKFYCKINELLIQLVIQDSHILGSRFSGILFFCQNEIFIHPQQFQFHYQKVFR